MLPKTYGQTKPPLGEKINFAHPLAKGLVGMWLLNEGNGNKAYDLSGNGNTGTLTSMASPPTATSGWNPCKFGKGLIFDGADDYVDCGNGASLQVTSAFSVEAWFNKTGTPSDANRYGIVKKWGGGTGFNGFNMFCGYVNSVNMQIGKTGIDDLVVTIPISGWVHIIFTLNGTDFRGYVNGVLAGSKTATINGIATYNNVIIGIEGVKFTYFNGSIDEVRVYNRALTAGEIMKLYMSPFCMFGKKDVFNKKI